MEFEFVEGRIRKVIATESLPDGDIKKLEFERLPLGGDILLLAMDTQAGSCCHFFLTKESAIELIALLQTLTND